MQHCWVARRMLLTRMLVRMLIRMLIIMVNSKPIKLVIAAISRCRVYRSDRPNVVVLLFPLSLPYHLLYPLLFFTAAHLRISLSNSIWITFLKWRSYFSKHKSNISYSSYFPLSPQDKCILFRRIPVSFNLLNQLFNQIAKSNEEFSVSIS